MTKKVVEVLKSRGIAISTYYHDWCDDSRGGGGITVHDIRQQIK